MGELVRREDVPEQDEVALPQAAAPSDADRGSRPALLGSMFRRPFDVTHVVTVARLIRRAKWEIGRTRTSAVGSRRYECVDPGSHRRGPDLKIRNTRHARRRQPARWHRSTRDSRIEAGNRWCAYARRTSQR